MPSISCFSRPSLSQETLVYDSMIYKATACIPLVGAIAGCIIESKIAHQIEYSQEISKTAQLIELKNHYKIAAIVHNFILIAVIATLMATGILQTTPQLAIGGSLIALVSGVILLHGYRLHFNQKVINQLWGGGYSYQTGVVL